MNSPPSSPRRRILLIGWDAADWMHIQPLLDAGEMPTLAGLMRRGAWGNLATLQPMVSPMLWNSIATGHTADRHGVLGFVEPKPSGQGCRPWSSLTRRTKTVWNILQQHGWRCHVAGWWASHPAEPGNGIQVTNLFADSPSDRPCAGSVHPPEWTSKLAKLRFAPAELGPEHLLPFVPRAAEVDQAKDQRLAMLARLVADCVTMQAVATTLLEETPWDFTAVYFDGIDHFCHGFMPYHPPRLPHIPEADFAMYREVVSGAYRFHDMMLERLLQLAGRETTVILCSDHGFHSGPYRPRCNPTDPAGPTLWHRDMGILVMAGPGICQGRRIFGASLLDVTPTILTLCGLPCGKDMAGKPLFDVLEHPAAPERILSWELAPGEDGRHQPDTAWPAEDDGAAVSLTKQFVALGYIEDPGGNPDEGAAAAQAEAHYNLAQVYLSTERPAEAADLLAQLVRQRPWETRYIHQWANALVRGGWFAQGREVLAHAYPNPDESHPPAVVQLILARACLGLGDFRGAGNCLSKAAAALPALPGPFVELGQLASMARQWNLAENAFQQAISLDDSFPTAWQGLAQVFLHRHDYQNALESATEALRRLWQMADAHFTAAISLAHLGRYEEARAAFALVGKLRPGRPEPWRWLAILPDTGSSSVQNRIFYRSEATRLAKLRVIEKQQATSRAKQTWPVPELPPPKFRQHHVTATRPARIGGSGRTLTIVSGLPRSGTSLLMQMLAAGGLAPQTDGIRIADANNPHGYFEWEDIRQISRRPELLDDPALESRAIKVVSPLLRSLPLHHRYRVLFMMRPADAVARSQLRMLERIGAAPVNSNVVELAQMLECHRQATLDWLRGLLCFEIIPVEFDSLLQDPNPTIESLRASLPSHFLPHPERMAAMIHLRSQTESR